jgi:hypothetical protein
LRRVSLSSTHMAGVAPHPLGRARRRAGRALSPALLVGLLAVLMIGGGSAAPSQALAAKAADACPPQPYGLAASTGDPASSFTMLIRINTQGNINTWTQYNTSPEKGGLAPYVRPQDIFVINTRFAGTANSDSPPVTPSVAATYAAELRAAFPCNRIVALNGLSLDPTQPGYAFSLLGDPNTSALLTDFEQTDWNSTAFTQPGRPPWTNDFATALPRIKGWDFTMASTAAANPSAAAQRTGLVPQDNATWNFGQIAQDLNKKNLRLGIKLGPMAVQTQDTCADAGSAGFGARAKALRIQYSFKFITKKVRVRRKGKIRKVKKTIRLPLKKKAKPRLDNLAMEISFNSSPQASASQAILSTSAAQAAACVPPAMRQGINGFFFFAAEDAMRLLLQQPQIAAFRPPVGAVTSSASGGGVGAPG